MNDRSHLLLDRPGANGYWWLVGLIRIPGTAR